MDTVSRKLSKKNLEPVDDWLGKEGYFRKMAPKDSTCLFRVISEQIYLTQHDHIRVRKECVEFMQKNPNIIEKYATISVKDYLDQMACFTQWGGDNEIRAMSMLYNVDFIVFNAHKFTKTVLTNNGFKKSIYLCYTPPRQYDGVFTQEYMSNAAFCQSIVYQNLYKNVFKMTDIDNTIHKMLYEKSSEYRHDKFFLKGNLEIRDQLKLALFNKLDNCCDENEENRPANSSSAPFPYRVAKALDPQIFRNTDLDVWHEIKREVRNAGWTRFNNDFQIGAKCLVQLENKAENTDKENNNTLYATEIKDLNDDSKLPKSSKKEDPVLYNGHIQEMSKNEGPVVVYIEELGERKTVPYSALKPLSVRKTKQNPNWNNNGSKKNMNPDQNSKWKKLWGCSRRTKDHGQNMSMPNFERNSNNGNRKDGNDSNKDWIENSHKNEPLMVSDKYKMQNFNTSPNYIEAPPNMVSIENGQYQMPENSHRRIPDDEDKKPMQSDVNRNTINMKNQHHYAHGNVGGNVYSPTPQYTNLESAPITPTVQPINLSVSKSVDINGSDLPYSEPYTLRFFYNLGLDYFHANQMWNYPSNDQMIAPAFFTSQNPPPLTGAPNPPVVPNGVNMNEEVDQVGDMNRSKPHNMRRKDDSADRGRNNLQKNNVPRNNERYHKSVQNVQVQGHDQQKNVREFNKGTPHNNVERKEHQNMNKDTQRNNKNGPGPRFRKNDGCRNHMHQMHQQKQEHQHANQSRYSNGAAKSNGEPPQQNEMEPMAAPVQQQQSFGGPALYPVPFNQPPIYGQVAVCGSEAEAYAGYYPPQPNFFPVVYQSPGVGNGEPPVSIDESGYQVFPQYMYHQAPLYGVSGVPENWYPVAGAPPTFVPYGPMVSPNTPNNAQNAPAV